VFATYLWGDYLDSVGRPVFIDGRTELYTGDGVLTRYLALQDVTADPDPVLRSYGVTYVLWTPGTGLSVYLEHDPSWRLVWSSRNAVVLRYVGTTAPAAIPGTKT